MNKQISGRIKAVECSEGYIVTASSTGELKVWNSNLTELCKINTGCRITCMKITQWLGFTIKEEPLNDAETKVFQAAKPVESKVIVEYDQSSEDEDVAPKKAREQQRNPAVSGKSKINQIKRLKGKKKVGQLDAVIQNKSKKMKKKNKKG